MNRAIFYAVSVLLGLWVSWMWVDNELPYTYFPDESAITPNPALDGGQVTVNWKIKVHRSCPGTSQRMMLDGKTRRQVATYDATPAVTSVTTADQNLVRTFMLPSGLPPEVIYKSNIGFECNLLQKIFPLRQVTPELRFRVVQRTAQ